MARDRGGDARPFNQRNDVGPMGYRTENDPVDDRPLLVWTPFWASESERLTYEGAVSETPRKAGEGPMAYAARIAAKVTGLYQQAGQSMPRRIGQKQWARQQWAAKQKGGLRMDTDEVG